MTLHLLSIGSSHPSNCIDNKFLEDLGIDSDSEWITAKLGIDTRYSVLPLDYIKDTKNKDPLKAIELVEKTPVQMAVEASVKALEKINLSADDIGLVICNTCTPYNLSPTTSSSIAKELKITAPTYDVFTACPAFALHNHYLNLFKNDKLPDYILCISTATLTARVDYTNRSDSAIWGDAAAAWIISTKKEGKLKLIDSNFNANPQRSNAVVIDTFDYFKQDGRAVRDFSVRQTVRMIKDFEKRYDLNWERDKFIGHQANGTMLEQIRKNRKVPHQNHFTNVKVRGNQAAAGSACALAENWDKLNTKDNLVIAVLGAGLSWSANLFEVL